MVKAYRRERLVSDAVEDLAQHWEKRYAAGGQLWSGRVNPSLVRAIDAEVPGRAIDIACGEGGDALWLAERGWSVTGVDISATAVARASAEAGVRGLAQRCRFEAGDLLHFTPDEQADLVYSCFLHSTVDFPRIEILRRASTWVKRAGALVVVSHAEPPPWSAHWHERGHEFHDADAEVKELGLGGQWHVERAETVTRTGKGPDGQEGTLRDAIVVLRLLNEA